MEHTGVEQEGKSDTATLPDGRKLGFSICGETTSASHTVFYLHGFGGSRLEGSLFAAAAKQLGATIISVERPGIGLSTPQPNRTVLDHADDISHLAEHLGLDTYSVVGVSGGGPYALACAYSHSPERLKGVALVCAVGPYDDSWRDMRWANRLIFDGLYYVPFLVRILVQITSRAQLRMSDDKLVAILRAQLNTEKDRLAISDPEVCRLFMASAREQFRQGVDATMEEGRLLTTALGFELEDVKQPVRLCYGKQDVNVPVSIGEELMRRLPEGTRLTVEDETHLSMVVNCRERVLRDLLSAGS